MSMSLKEALAYITPHPLTKGPMLMTADKLRAAAETIQTELSWWEEQSMEATETFEMLTMACLGLRQRRIAAEAERDAAIARAEEKTR